jgi:hypothetical protein
MKISLKKITLTLFFFFFVPSFVFAEPQVALTLKPANPSPYSTVTITALSYSFDVNTAMITWKKGNTIILSGQGEKNLTVETGGVGSQGIINVTLETSTGIVVEQQIIITPESVNVIYESPESYIPLFYEGLALPSDQSKVHFTALPQMSDGAGIIPAKNIAYSWYVNNTYVEGASGAGKQTAIIPLDILTESTEVKVIARTPQGVVAEKTVTVFPHPVMPLLYGYDDIFGTNFSQLYTKRIEATKDFVLSLEPYFLSMNHELNQTASFRWTLGGLSITPLGGRVLSMHPKEDSYGSQTLSISLSNTKRRMQTGTIDTNLIFDTRK